MKIIDFHTHFFPGEIAKKTVEYLSEKGMVNYFGDGALRGLKDFMKTDGITLSINAPIATKPEQVISINRKMIEYNSVEKSVMCFGTMHYAFPGDIDEELGYIKSKGIKGIKLHPEYQEYYPDDGKMKKTYEACVKHGLVVLCHAGADAAFDFDAARATPKRFLAVLKSYPTLKLVLAHMGGYRMWDEVFKHLIGKDVYFDTAYTAEMEDRTFGGMISAHGADKIVFGTDFPWERGKTIIEKINRSVSDASDKEKIFHINAERLLGL